MKIKMSRSQWVSIGEKSGWFKQSGHYDYKIKCQECGTMCNYDEIDKVMGIKVCKNCCGKILEQTKQTI